MSYTPPSDFLQHPQNPDLFYKESRVIDPVTSVPMREITYFYQSSGQTQTRLYPLE